MSKLLEVDSGLGWLRLNGVGLRCIDLRRVYCQTQGNEGKNTGDEAIVNGAQSLLLIGRKLRLLYRNPDFVRLYWGMLQIE